MEKDGTKFDILPQQSGDYTIQILGITSGKNLSGFVDVDDGRSYIIGAISKTDGTKFDDYADIQMSPLVSGYETWKVNIFTLDSGKSEFISDDNLTDYFVYECDTLEILLTGLYIFPFMKEYLPLPKFSNIIRTER